jgi:hypothetical protein
MTSEFEYADIAASSYELGRYVAFWSEEGWDVVAASLVPDTCSNRCRALLRRPRGTSSTAPPGYCIVTGDVVVRRTDSGDWEASRWTASRVVIARSTGHSTENEAVTGIGRFQLTAEEQALATRDLSGADVAFESVAQRLGELCFGDIETLVREFRTDYKRHRPESA